MTERELLGLIAMQVSTLTTQVDNLTGGMAGIKLRLTSIENTVTVKKLIFLLLNIIEHDYPVIDNAGTT